MPSNAVRIGALLAFLAHLALTVGYVMPPSTLKSSMQPLLETTIGAYFEQNWSLFAPTPRSLDQVLLAHPLTAAEAADIPLGGLPSSGWYDLSTPLKTAFSQNRFSAYERLLRPQSQAVLTYFSADSGLTPWRRSCEEGDAASCSIYAQRLLLARAGPSALLARISSSFYRDIARPGDEFSFVALRVRAAAAVPWDRRYSARRVSQDIELGVYPFDGRVEPAGLYRAATAK